MTTTKQTAAQARLTLALVRLADQGQRPRCGDPTDHNRWISEDPDERAQAATWCVGCLTECGEAAEAGNEKWGVWGGVDRSPNPKAATTRKRAAA